MTLWGEAGENRETNKKNPSNMKEIHSDSDAAARVSFRATTAVGRGHETAPALSGAGVRRAV